ncbi:MAG: DHA2 family efflux MFS transporter permease subunit [Streptosporangiaceae bacterium]|jgi:EmrB/QacA subfamily drug resistance transporter
MSAATADKQDEKLDPKVIKLAFVLLTGAIAALLDTTVVNVALKTIGADLHAPLAQTQWILTGYLLTFGMVIPFSGWALARFGGKVTWMASLSLFLAGSIASGLAWNIESLIAFRVVQGIGGGMLVPVFMTLLIQAAGGRSLGRLMATITLPAVVVPILGPVIGGLIVSNLSWRWIFYVNVPICAAALLLAWRFVPGRGPSAGPRPRLDIVGIALLSPAVALLLYGLAQVSTSGGFGQPKVLVPLAAGVVLLTLFLLRAIRTPDGGVIDVRLFRMRSFSAASALMFGSGLSMYGALLLLPLYYQQLRGYSPLDAGLLMAPQGIGSLLPRMFAGKVTDRMGPRPVVMAGMALAALGTAPFIFAGPHTNLVWLSLVLAVRGAGLSAATISLQAGAFIGLPREKVPDASSATRIILQVGGSFGTGVLAVILASTGSFHTTFAWATGFTAATAVAAPLLAKRK